MRISCKPLAASGSYFLPPPGSWPQILQKISVLPLAGINLPPFFPGRDILHRQSPLSSSELRRPPPLPSCEERQMASLAAAPATVARAALLPKPAAATGASSLPLLGTIVSSPLLLRLSGSAPLLEMGMGSFSI